MTIKTRVLGFPGKDNCVYLKVDSGQNVTHLLFDCGENCIFPLGKAVLQDLEHLFISHCHMDHISGFDGLFRHLYFRKRPFHIWGPSGIQKIMQGRFQGFTWNLIGNSPGKMIVHEISRDQIHSAFYLTREKFLKKHDMSEKSYNGEIFASEDFIVNCEIMDHLIESLSYCVYESPRKNINIQKLAEQGFKPGKWCAALKDTFMDEQTLISVNGKEYSLKDLKNRLMDVKKGEKVSFITDIIMDKDNQLKLKKLAADSDLLIIESSYLDSELKLAKKNYHLTVSEAVLAGKEVHAEKIILFHVSDRYSFNELAVMLEQAKSLFQNVFFPSHWKILTEK